MKKQVKQAKQVKPGVPGLIAGTLVALPDGKFKAMRMGRKGNLVLTHAGPHPVTGLFKHKKKQAKQVKQGVPAPAKKESPVFSLLDVLRDAPSTFDVKSLILAGADVHERSEEGMTPLSMAAVRGLSSFIYILRAAGADPNVKDNVGMTPLHWAANRGHVETVRILLSLGADVNAKTKTGSTPLHIATPECFSLLEAAQKQAKQDVNAKNPNNGWTPLHQAVKVGSLSEVQRLIADSFQVKDALNGVLADQTLSLEGKCTAALVEASASLFTAITKLRQARDYADAVESLVILPLIEQAKEVIQKVEALTAARRSNH
jgi:ankyrin repeat protein